MALQVDLTKSAGALRLSLEKAGILTPPSVEVAFDLDVSGSYEDEHLDGSTNDLMTRLVPWGLVFDPDKQLDVFTFSSGPSGVYNPGQVNANNYEGFVKKNVIGCPGWRGGTSYAPVLRKNLELFGWLPSSDGPSERRGGFLGFGGKPAAQSTQAPKRKSLVLFNTDGANDDKAQTEQLFAEMQRNNYQMYVAFIAYANGNPDFSFIHGLADKYNNCGIVIIKNMKQWTAKSDDEINAEIITPELVEWLKA